MLNVLKIKVTFALFAFSFYLLAVIKISQQITNLQLEANKYFRSLQVKTQQPAF